MPQSRDAESRYKNVTKSGAEDVTIIVSFRERWRFTQLTIEMILKNNAGGFRLLVLDSGMPQPVKNGLKRHVQSGDLEIIDVGRGTQPNNARATVIPLLTSRYAIFIDNDAIVMPGWLDHLIVCADETGAGIVSPLYLWGKDIQSDLVHMAGGDLVFTSDDTGQRMTGKHRHAMRTLSQLPQGFARQKCDFGEFHCLMMRREVYTAGGMFDPAIVTVHEHIHASLLARELGYETWLEPLAKVNYLAFMRWHIEELADFRQRWNVVTAEDSLKGFAARWNLVDDPQYRAPIRHFLIKHVGRADVLDIRPGTAAQRGRIMQRGNLQQNFSGLQFMALQTGYSHQDIADLGRAYRLMIELMDGIYRPCGRPFANHLVGTASVLLFYGCSLRLIMAGMLHAVFSHASPKSAKISDQRITDAISTIGSEGLNAASLALAHRDRKALYSRLSASPGPVNGLPINVAETLLLDMANSLELYLSLEDAMTGRGKFLPPEMQEIAQNVANAVGLTGLAQSVAALREDGQRFPLSRFADHLHGSFAFHKGKLISTLRRKLPPSEAQITAIKG